MLLVRLPKNFEFPNSRVWLKHCQRWRADWFHWFSPRTLLQVVRMRGTSLMSQRHCRCKRMWIGNTDKCWETAEGNAKRAGFRAIKKSHNEWEMICEECGAFLGPKNLGSEILGFAKFWPTWYGTVMKFKSSSSATIKEERLKVEQLKRSLRFQTFRNRVIQIEFKRVGSKP